MTNKQNTLPESTTTYRYHSVASCGEVEQLSEEDVSSPTDWGETNKGTPYVSGTSIIHCPTLIRLVHYQLYHPKIIPSQTLALACTYLSLWNRTSELFVSIWRSDRVCAAHISSLASELTGQSEPSHNGIEAIHSLYYCTGTRLPLPLWIDSLVHGPSQKIGGPPRD